MAFDYSELAATATELLTEFGQTVTRRAYTNGAYDTATGTAATTTADTSRVGVLLSIESGGRRDSEFVRGSLVMVGDRRLLLDATAAVAVTDHYIVGGTEYTVVSFDEVKPATVAVLYDLHVRLA